MTDLEIHFPKPCDEPWEAMAPHGCNRHCASCDTIVHDLAALTFEEAAGLIASKDEVCVRAEIGAGDVVKLRPSGQSRARRMVVAAGASLGLATAACQTTPDQTAPRYSISGQINDGLARKVILSSDAGKEIRRNLKNSASKFEFKNLTPGTYLLTVKGECGYYAEGPKVTIIDRSIALDDVTYESENGEGCPIIIGRIRQVDRPELG